MIDPPQSDGMKYLPCIRVGLVHDILRNWPQGKMVVRCRRFDLTIAILTSLHDDDSAQSPFCEMKRGAAEQAAIKLGGGPPAVKMDVFEGCVNAILVTQPLTRSFLDSSAKACLPVYREQYVGEVNPI